MIDNIPTELLATSCLQLQSVASFLCGLNQNISSPLHAVWKSLRCVDFIRHYIVDSKNMNKEVINRTIAALINETTEQMDPSLAGHELRLNWQT